MGSSIPPTSPHHFQSRHPFQRSGYPERFRHEIISDALQGFKNMQKREQEGGQPVDRPRNYDEAGRRRRKLEKSGRWYRREPRGRSIREGVLVVPPTPDGALAMAMKKVCEEELKGHKTKLTRKDGLISSPACTVGFGPLQWLHQCMSNGQEGC